MVDFQVTTDFSQVEKMIKRFGTQATTEYKKAVNNTIIHGYRIAPESTPIGRRGSGKLKNDKSWKHKITGLSGVLWNKQPYAGYVDKGWERKQVLVLKKPIAFALKSYKQSKNPSMKALFNQYGKAMKKLSGKDYSQKEKQAIVSYDTGIAIGRKFKPCKFKGYQFITKNIYPRMQKRFEMEVTLANKRLVG